MVSEPRARRMRIRDVSHGYNRQQRWLIRLLMMMILAMATTTSTKLRVSAAAPTTTTSSIVSLHSKRSSCSTTTANELDRGNLDWTTIKPRSLAFGVVRPTSISSCSRQLDNNDEIISCSSMIRYSDLINNIRGGSSDDDEEEDEEIEEEDVDEEIEAEEEEEEEAGEDKATDDSSTAVESSTSASILDLSKRAAILLGKVAIKTIKVARAIKRAIVAGLEGEADANDDEEKGEVSMMMKVSRTLNRMVQALLNPPSVDGENDGSLDSVCLAKKTKPKKTKVDVDDEEEEEKESPKASSSGGVKSDFGTFLSQTYDVEDNRSDDGVQVLGGSLNDALEEARSQARLLVVMIPSSKPNKKQKNTLDQQAIQSLLSAEVSKAANKRSRKKGPTATGSFLFWSAKFGSSEATTAVKRLKVKATSSTKGGKRPFLLVVYPDQKLAPSGVKLVPRLVAQHHCNPPPEASIMVAWLNSLRKRHAKQYNDMQTALKELEYYKERKEGYKDSVKSDIKRQEQEAQEEAERLAKEKEEKERQEAILKRREELKSSLPEEYTGKDAKTIALRFADGKTDKRRFAPDTSLSTVFNWVDAMHDMERETVILTTMRGDKTFSWEEDKIEQTLDDVGLAKNTGLRVTIKKEESSEAEGEEKGNDS